MIPENEKYNYTTIHLCCYACIFRSNKALYVWLVGDNQNNLSRTEVDWVTCEVDQCLEIGP